jgi:hypothetical protein
MGVEEAEVQCPFCGEPITILVDCSEDHQTYIEDCEVCCRPINFTAVCEDGELISLTPQR